MKNKNKEIIRKQISKKTRFEVFKRDKFTCQYCGREAPNIILEIDHINPVYEGGNNDILNLITSCFDCNRGKGKIKLDDDTVIVKQKKQFNELQERRNQLDMMIEWHNEVNKIDDYGVKKLSNYWSKAIHPFKLTNAQLKELKKLVNKTSIEEILKCMDISNTTYIQRDDTGKVLYTSTEKAFQYIKNIIVCRKREIENPKLAELYHIRAYMNKRYDYINFNTALTLLKDAFYNSKISIDYLWDTCKNGTSWTNWRESMEELIDNSNSEN